MSDIAALIAKLEAASEGSRELDARIEAAVRWDRPGACFEFKCGSREFKVSIGDARFTDIASRTYTASIDAALTLVPNGSWWHMQCLPNAHIADSRSSASVTTDRVHEWHSAATPALALCIAALRAREAQK